MVGDVLRGGEGATPKRRHYAGSGRLDLLGRSTYGMDTNRKFIQLEMERFVRNYLEKHPPRRPVSNRVCRNLFGSPSLEENARMEYDLATTSNIMSGAWSFNFNAGRPLPPSVDSKWSWGREGERRKKRKVKQSLIPDYMAIKKNSSPTSTSIRIKDNAQISPSKPAASAETD